MDQFKNVVWNFEVGRLSATFKLIGKVGKVAGLID